MKARMLNIDGNEAASRIAYRLSEVIAIYPITPSSPMGEHSDAWAARGLPNIWGTVPEVVEMQSEGGASGAVHGSLTTGALTTTFTASQGLLLMIPNMFKIAGELTPTVFHVAARSAASHALSIFGDHSDVMATRSTGFGAMASGSIQEVQDVAAIAHAATLRSRIPMVHFFDGFRSSHEVMKVEEVTDEQLRQLVDEDLALAHRERGLSPDHPVIRGTAQNPDVFFQNRETVNPYYQACPGIVQEVMDRFAAITGRRYRLFDYIGAPDAERVVVIMASGAEAAHEAVEFLAGQGEKVGVIKVRLYRPFSVDALMQALPPTVRSVAVLDRTKEPGAVGEPLYQDVAMAISEAMDRGVAPFSRIPKVVGGRYGLSSKEFTPAMVKAVLDDLKESRPKNHFTVGIVDDVTGTSLNVDESFGTEPEDVFRGVFYGLGSDGTVGANKNSIKIIGEETNNYAQGYFVYDSRKAGSVTVSHLRFGPRPIHSTYLINRANFVACHQWVFLDRYDMLAHAEPGATFLLNSPYGPDEVWDRLPREVQEQIIEKQLKFWVIDGYKVAAETGMGARINTIMQTCFFAISEILPRERAIAAIKNAITKTYSARGDEIVRRNHQAVDQALERMHEVKVPTEVTATRARPPVVPEEAPEFVKKVTAVMIAGKGDSLPVSVFPCDGTWPVGSTRWEKRNLALEIPVWDPDVCIQCGKCAIVCPHAAIRTKVYDPKHLAGAPSTFLSSDYRGKEFPGMKYTVQTAPEDCTGCGLCVEACPARNKSEAKLKAINMRPQPPIRDAERENYRFFLDLPEADRSTVRVDTVKGCQLLEPLFEYSGACAGCGETPYVKLLSQLFGDRALVANATGCSSIYGANLPTLPWTTNREGRGPAWSNSLFEDNAEFGLGFRLALDKHAEQARELLAQLADQVGRELAEGILNATQGTEAEIHEQRERVARLTDRLQKMNSPESTRLLSLADNLVRRSVWIVGGDGWAYDIGYGGLDHVLASGRNVNLLVLDTEVYSNTGGQMSKATPLGAVAKFAAGGKPRPKKDLALMAVAYRDVYVARVAMGANDLHTVKSFLEAEAYDGPSLIVAYSHCIAHGINMRLGMQQQKAAVECGYWPLMRFNPALPGEHPFKLDSKPPKRRFKEYAYQENRYRMLTKMDPERAERLLVEAQEHVTAQYRLYQELAGLTRPEQAADMAEQATT